MSKNINARIALKRDTSANWESSNPVILNGELILVDTAAGELRAKVGDGTKTYTQLPFTDEVLRSLITDVENNNSAVVITKDGESRLLDTFNIIKLTQEEYDELEASNLLDPDALYLTEGGEEQVYSKVVMTEGDETKVLEEFHIVKLTQEEYDAMVEAGTNDPDTLYMTEVGDASTNNSCNIINLTESTNLNSLITPGIYTIDPSLVINGPITVTQSGGLAFVIVNTPTSSSIGGDIGTMTSAIQSFYYNKEYYRIGHQMGDNFTNPSGWEGWRANAYNYDAVNFSTVNITNSTASTSTTTGALTVSGGAGFAGDVYANKVYGAVWNDYAEYREGPQFILPGEVVYEKGDDTLALCDEDCAAGCYIVSDTFGFAIGQTKKANLPVAVSGRVLVYTAEDRMTYKDAIGRPVCGTKGGRIRLMTDEEATRFPWKILGTVSSVPEYKTWGDKEIEVNDRIWVKVR